MTAAAPAVSRLRRWAPDLAAASGYLLLSGLYAWRTIVAFGSKIAGHGGDGWQNLWNMWWFKEALATGQNLYFTDLLHQPTGTTLLFHTLNPFNCLLALPFDLVFDQPAAYNIVFLFAFASSGFTMYLLAFELCGSRRAAFISGLVFTFSHYHFAHAQGHLNLISMEWLPLFLLGLVRVWRRKRIRDGLLMGFSLTLTAFCDVYYVMFGVVIAGLAVLVQLVRHPRGVIRKDVLVPAAAGALAFLCTGGILIVAMLASYLGTEFVPTHDPRFWSADLQAFFIPDWISAYGGLFGNISEKWTGNSAECCQYLGYSVLALSFLAFFLAPKGRKPWAWGGLSLFGMVLALGPVLHWGGKILDDVPLAFGPLSKVLPFLRMSGAPVRWHFLALIGTSILAGMGTGPLISKLAYRKLWKFPAGVVVFVLCGAIVLAELAPHWIDAREVVFPSFTQALRDEPAGYVVYDIGDDNEALLRQVGHHHKMIGGYISRPTAIADNFLKSSPLLRALRGEDTMDPAELSEQAKKLSLRFVIAPADRASKLSALGLSQRWSDAGLVVFEIPWRPS